MNEVKSTHSKHDWFSVLFCYATASIDIVAALAGTYRRLLALITGTSHAGTVVPR